MIERILVVDCGAKDFQYMIVDILNNGIKVITKYDKTVYDLVGKSYIRIDKEIIDVFNKYNCTEIYMNIMGTSCGVYDSFPDDIKKITHGYKLSSQIINNRICELLKDFRERNILVGIEAIKLCDVVKCIMDESCFYFDQIGLRKINRNLDDEIRSKLHIFLGMYEIK